MIGRQRGERIPGYRIDQTLMAVDRFRAAWGRYHRPDDVRHLLRIFRKVEIQRGYELDYIPLRGRERGWIWPYCRSSAPGVPAGSPEALRAIPPDRLVGQERGKGLRALEVETLYRFLSYERSPQGLFEYGYFVNELWATKSAAREGDWLALEPLVVRHKFDSVLRREHQNLVRVARPDHFDPIVHLAEGGGSAEFFAYQPGPWVRILRVQLTVEADGGANWRPGEVIASLSG